MSYEAIIETGGKQYAVNTGDIIRVPRLPGDTGETVSFDRVLMARQGQEVRTGQPLVEGAKVDAEIVRQVRDPKITVFRFKRRTTYRKKTGHRQPRTAVRITAVHA